MLVKTHYFELVASIYVISSLNVENSFQVYKRAFILSLNFKITLSVALQLIQDFHRMKDNEISDKNT